MAWQSGDPPETADQIRERIAGRGKPAASTPDAPEAPPRARVVNIFTREPVDETKPKRRRGPLISPVMIAELRALLADAESGKITSISYAVSGRKGMWWTGNFLHECPSSWEVERLALMHMGAVDLVKASLTDIASGMMDYDGDEDAEEEGEGP